MTFLQYLFCKTLNNKQLKNLHPQILPVFAYFERKNAASGVKVPVALSEWSSKKVATYKVADFLDGQSSTNAVLVCELKVVADVYKSLH